jgi:hypothetical protein
MKNETVEQALDLQHNIGHLDLQIRKCKEAISFMDANGEEGYHYHLTVLTTGIVKNHTSWHFLPQYFLEMLKPQLEKFEVERAALQAQYEAL